MRVTAALVALALAALPALGAAAVARPGPRVAAHRGGALLWPENSLLAFRNALALGVDALEADIHLTADGEVVVIHDPTLDRTTTGRGAVAAAALANLRDLRLRDGAGRPTEEPVPALGALLDLLAPSRADLLLEIKVGADGSRYPGIEEKVLALVRARGLAPRVVLMAFEQATVRRVRELDPDIRTAFLVGRAWVGRAAAEAVALAVEAGATAIGYHHRLVDAAAVAAARKAGLAVAAWTVNDEADIRRVVALGVDVVISDRPDLALRVARP